MFKVLKVGLTYVTPYNRNFEILSFNSNEVICREIFFDDEGCYQCMGDAECFTYDDLCSLFDVDSLEVFNE